MKLLCQAHAASAVICLLLSNSLRGQMGLGSKTKMNGTGWWLEVFRVVIR